MLTLVSTGTLRAAAIKISMSVATQTPPAHEGVTDHEQKRLALGYAENLAPRIRNGEFSVEISRQ
jgi:hypothetical protein